jgi:hypothetical protein
MRVALSWWPRPRLERHLRGLMPAAIRKLGGAIFCDRRYNHCLKSNIYCYTADMNNRTILGVSVSILILACVGFYALWQYGPKLLQRNYCTQQQRMAEENYQNHLATLNQRTTTLRGKVIASNGVCYVGSGCTITLDTGKTIVTKVEPELSTCPSQYAVQQEWGSVSGISYTNDDIGKSIEASVAETESSLYTLKGSQNFYVRVIE